MKADQAMGLVSAGSVSRSFLARMPSLEAHLGPIKASSFQAAKSAVKTLHAGYAVTHYSALEMSRWIWVHVPEAELDRVVQELAAQMPVHRTMVVVCGCTRESTWPNPLTALGARMASLNVVEGSRDSIFITEGHPETVRVLKRFLAAQRRKLITLEPGSKALYFAGVHSATHLLLPWVDAAASSLRAAGFPRAEAMEVTDALVRRVLRNYGNSGVKAWDARAGSQLRKALVDDAHMLGTRDPRMAALYSEGIRLALKHFSSHGLAAGR